MGNGADRISELPDAILVGILSRLPMKQVARVGILSRRWRGLYAENMSMRRELDFVGEIRQRHTPEEFVEKVNLCLQRHSVSKVYRLHVSVELPHSCSPDLERWVAFAANKGVEDLALDFTPEQEGDQEDDIFDQDGHAFARNKFAIQSGAFAAAPGSLRSISLTRCDFSPDFDFVNLASTLRRASFKNCNITSKDLQSLLSLCSTLESLLLWECPRIDSVVVGDGAGCCSSSRLKELVIANCWEVYEVVISAPSLRSFQFYGDLYFDFAFKDISGLEDALLSCVDHQTELPDHDPIMALRDVSHASVLTLCYSTPLHVSIVSEDPILADDLPVNLGNLKELQLLLGVFNDEYLGYTYDFFRFCPTPLLEQIFIRLPVTLYENHSISVAVHRKIDPPELHFHHLKTVKLINFFGTEPDLLLVLYFLEHAPVLEKLVIVASRSPSPIAPNRGAVGEKLASQMSKASSPLVQLMFYEHREDSSGLNPTHMETYDDESCTRGNML